MQEKLKDVYTQGREIIDSYQDKSNGTTDCQFDLKSQEIQFYSINDLECSNSLKPCNSYQISQYYNNFAIINAFNVLQSQISLMKDIYENRENPYAIWLCDQGEWKIIIVNDKVPCVKNINNKIESAFQCNLQWPIIIEKAVVKLLGDNYDLFNHLVTKSIQSFIYLLIGQPIQRIQIKTIDELKFLLEQKNSIFYFEYYHNTRDNAYVITSVKENHVELQAINQESINDEGIKQQDSKFLLSWNALQIQNIFQVHLNKGYQTYTFTMQQPIVKKLQFIEHTYIYTFKINNKQKNDYWISICQRDQNLNSSKQQKEIKYGLIQLMLFKNNKKNYQLISQSIDWNQNLYHKTELQKGEYTLFCQAEFYNLESLPEELQIQQQILKLQFQGIQTPQKFDQKNQNDQTLKQLIISLIRQKSTNQNTYEYKNEGFPQVQRSLDKINGFLYIYYENHGDSTFEEYIKFIKHRNLIRYETQQMETRIKVSIPSKEYMLYLYKFDPRILIDSNSIFFDYTLNFNSQEQQSEIIQQQSEVIQQQSEVIQKQSEVIPKQSKIIISKSKIVPNQPEIILCKSKIIQKSSIYKPPDKIQNQPLYDYVYNKKDQQFKPIQNPQVYIQQHENGVLMLFVNQANNSIKVECELQLNNLLFLLNDQINLEDNTGIFQIDSKKHQYILLQILNPELKNYNYEIKIRVQNL